MRAYQLTEMKGPSGLALTTLDDPSPGPGEVLVRVGAVSLNFRDLSIAAGRYAFGTLAPPFVPCSDAAGTVVATGRGITRLKVGDRVAPTFFPRWVSGRVTREATATALGAGGTGTLAELIVIGADACVPVPAHLSHAEAACFPCAGVTAWNAVFGGGGIRPGETVVTQGSGGVALFALAFAKLAGARVIAITGGAAKRARLEALGADATIDYVATPEWDKAVLALTEGNGAELVVDLAGPTTLQRSLNAVAHGGSVTVIGAAAGLGEINPMPIARSSATLRGFLVGSRAIFEDMNRAVEALRLRPVIDRTFPFEEAPAAYAYMAERSHVGKVCITVGG